MAGPHLHRRRLRDLSWGARWSLTIAAVLIGALWAFSAKCMARCVWHHVGMAQLSGGVLTIVYVPKVEAGSEHGPLFVVKDKLSLYWWPPLELHTDALRVRLVIALWFAFLIAAAPAGFLWHRHRRAIRASRLVGVCPHCRYNRARLADDAVCPECGTTR